MSIAGNKAVASEFFARLSAWDITGALGLMTDDGTWWLSGKRETLATAGVYDQAKLTRLFETMQSRLKGPLVMTIKSSIGEGDKVAMEAESLGELTNGRTYRQQYHFLMEFRDGKIHAVKEYLDTQHVYNVWLAP